MSYFDGFLIPVPAGNKEKYLEAARKMAPSFLKHGAIRVMEGWGDDLPEGKVTDFRSAVKAEEGETVVFSFVEWPSREVRDAGNKKVEAEMTAEWEASGKTEMPFDGKRLIFGGFVPILDEGK